MSDTPKLLSVKNISKDFGSVAALSGVDFELHAGEVLGVVGQRGSGKSTLFQVLSGVQQPSKGLLWFNGKQMSLRNASQARQFGIESVQQNPQLAGNFNVLDNIFLGREITHSPLLKMRPDQERMAQIATQLLDELLMPRELLFAHPNNLSNEQIQVVALCRALCHPSRLLLLDDALAALTFERQEKLLSHIKQMAAQNIAVILSSDDLKHIFAVTDHILVMYQGRQIALRKTSETTPREIVELIVGSNRQEKVTPVIWAFENYYAAQQQAEELRRAQMTLRESLEAQDSLNRQLVEKLRDQVEALDRLNLALQDANRRLMTEREAERKALARDLHDQVIQDLLSYNYQLEDAESETSDPEQREDLFKIRNGIRAVVSSLREVCSDLRPPTIDSHGLSAAIRSLAHQWSKMSGIKVTLNIDPELGRLPEPIELSVFRIVQEGLSNVRKHSDASNVHLALARSATASLLVELSDNGKGIAKPVNLAKLSAQKHFGLLGISERVTLLGGKMKVESAEGGGTMLKIEIPSPYPSLAGR